MLVKSLVAANVAAMMFVFVILSGATSCSIEKVKETFPAPSSGDILVMMIDTGIDADHKLLKDYVDRSRSVDLEDGDDQGDAHGTHVAGLIVYGRTIDEGHPVGLCHRVRIISCNKLHRDNSDIPACLDLALKMGVQYINISGGGDKAMPLERTLMQELDSKGVVIVMAAGNENNDLAEKPYYPASYKLKHSIVVANGTDREHKALTSNYGTDVVWEWGSDVLSTAPMDRFDRMTGTSQAAPIRLHKILMSLCETGVNYKLYNAPFRDTMVRYK